MILMDRETAVPKVKKIPGINAKKWRRFHERFAATSTFEWAFIWDRKREAIGPFCTDADGNVILDFASHVAINALGYNHPELIKLSKQLAEIDPDKYAGMDFVGAFGADPLKCEIPTPSHLQQKLIEISKKFGFGKTFLCNSGAEAAENAMKICYDFKRNFGYGFCFEGAFHGRTLGALSLNRSKAVHRKFFPQIPRIVSLPYCKCKGKCSCGWKNRQGKNLLQKLLDKKSGDILGKEIAFLIIEPIQGEGGYNIPNAEFMKEIGEICVRENIPVISDEIQAGIGRTGKMWAIEHFKLKPDLITCAKSLRVGAVIGKTKLFPKENGRISSTWGGGNAMSSAIGFKTIELIQKEHLLRNAEIMGNHFLRELHSLKNKFHFIEEVRGMGLMDAIELDTVQRKDKLKEKCLKNGLLLLGCGTKSIRFLPPLNVNKREIDLAVEILEKSLREARK